MRKHLLSLLFLSALQLVSANASATPNFPPAIQSDLGLSYNPECALCHLGGKTGGGTVTTPFGRSARARGMVAEDAAVLNAVLQQMKGERVDSDADGIPDIQELIEGTDPNAPANDTIGPQGFGCVGRVAPGRDLPGALPLLGLVFPALVLLARSRRRR